MVQQKSLLKIMSETRIAAEAAAVQLDYSVLLDPGNLSDSSNDGAGAYVEQF